MTKQKTKLQLEQELEWALNRIGELEHATSQLGSPKQSKENIAECRQLENQLIEKQKILETITGMIPDMVYLYHAQERRHLYINRELGDPLGYSSEEIELLGADVILNKIHPEDMPGVSEHINRMLQAEDNAIHEVEYRIEGKSGNTLWFSARERVYQRDQSGKPEILFGICQDITRRKKNAETLHESEMRWQFALEGAGDGLWDWNVQTGHVFFSSQWKSMLGYADNEIGNTLDEWKRRVHPDDLPGVLDQIARHFDSESPVYKCEHRVLCKDGNYKWILDRGKVIEWTVDHKPLRMIGTHKDISEHKRIEEVLLESTHLLNESQSIANLGSWTADLQTGIFDASPEGARLVGWDPGLHSGDELMNVIHPDDREYMQSSWAAAMEGAPYDIEHRIILNGEVRWLRIKARITLDTNGMPLSALGITQDITERKQAAILQETVYHIAEAAQKTSSLQHLYTEIHRNISIVMNARNFYIALYDKSDNNLLNFVYSVDEKDTVRESMPLGKGLTSHVLSTGSSFLYSSEQENSRMEVIGIPPMVWLGVPLIAYGQTIGMMAVQDYTDVRAYGMREQRILEFVSSQVANAIVLKRTNDMLQASQASLEMAQSIANLGSWELDPQNGAGLQWSKEMFHLFQCDPSQGIPPLSRFMEMVHADDRQRLLDAEKMAMKNGQDVTIEYRATPAMDGMRHFKATIRPMKNEQGQLTLISGTVLDITEVKQAFEQLRESEAKHRLLFETMAQGVVFQDSDGHIIHVNPAAKKILGLTLEQMRENTSTDPRWKAIHEDGSEFPGVTHPAMVALRTGQPVFNTIMGIYNPILEMHRWININAFPRFNGDGQKPYQVFATFEDITDRKKAEEALRESESKYRLLAENISDVIWILDVESSRFRYVSPSVAQMRGYRMEEVLNEDMAYSLTLASAQRLSQVTPERLAEFHQGVSKAYTDELEQTCKDGSTVWTEVTSRYMINPDNNRLEVYGVSRNIAERKKAEEVIRSIEKRNAALIEHAPDGIALVDGHGVFIFASPSAYRMFGYSTEEIVGTQSREKVHSEDVHLLANLRGKLLEAPDIPQTVEYRFLHKNGSYLWLESIYTNMFDEPGIDGIVINFRDITERKLSEEMTRQQNEQIQLLYEASQKLNRTLDLKEIYQTICDFMTVIVPNDTLFISAFDHETQLITCRAYWMEDKWLDVSEFPSIPLEEEGKGTQSLVIRTGKAMVVNDYQTLLKNTKNVYQVDAETNEIVHDDPPEDEVTRSALIVPLKSGGRVSGVIQIASYRQNAYTENQLKLLESLSLHIASAEQNAMLYTQMLVELNERKQAEEALRDSNETAQAILNASTESVFLMDFNGNILASNETTAARLGRQVEEIIGTNMYALIPPETAKTRKKQLNIVFNERKPVIFEDKRLDIWLENSIYPIFDNDGQVRRVAIYGRDITERKKAENALRESEEKYRVLIESLDNVVASVDGEGKFLYMNDTAAGQMGRSTDQLVGKTMYELFPETVASKQMESIKQVIQNDEGQVYESISIVQGKPRWYRTSVLPIHNEEGSVTQVLINSTDIDDLKTAQQELQDLNRTLEERVKQRTAEVQDLYENAPAGYHSLDANGIVTLINQTELNMLGYSREEMIGHPIMNFHTAASLDKFRKNFPEFKRHGWVRDLELEFVHKDGTIIPVLVNGTVIYDEQGNYIMSRSTVLDNTNQKAADAALRNANLELARAMRMKDEFLASMSHELRTPLTGILGLSEALQINVYGPINEKQQNTLANIEASGRHLLDLINDILDVSKIEAGKLELQMEACSLDEICQSSIQLTKGMAAKKRQAVNFTMSPANINVKGDARRLKQILVNLLSNSVKFTPEEGRLGLDVTANEQDHTARISIWDQGIGISSEDLKKLFQPFVQLDSSLSRQQSGTGLGLTLVQRLVELHGGSVEVTSAAGEGSRFTVTLPCMPTDSTAKDLEDSRQSIFHHVLIIEDTMADAEHLARYVRSLGITPILHTSGKDAVERAIETQPDVIFLDINLPEISGWEVLSQLKASRNTQHIPVIIASVDDDKQKAAELHADGYLVKFFSLADLRAALRHIQKPIKSNEETITPNIISEAPIATVMIVDDNEINISTLADFLSTQNLKIASVKSGVDFLTQISNVQPDIVLMDIQMPGMDGLETTRRLRLLSDHRLASVPVVAVTALAMPGDRERCIEAGADEYVTKPFRLLEIQDLILKMVAERKLSIGG